MRELRRVEKQELLTKLTPIVGSLVALKMEKDRWTKKEISAHTGVHASRLTEIQNFKKYRRVISESDLIALIGGGIVAVDELVRYPGLSLKDVEKHYLITQQIYEDKALQQLYHRLKSAGEDPAKILLDYWKSKKGR